MKKVVLILLVLINGYLTIWADRNNVISVLSFEMNPTDMEAMTNRITDDSGDLTALIKIETAARGFEFDCGSMGVVEVDENHPGEIWVYVQQSASRITISHADWGVLRDFKFPTGDLVEGRTYIMKIATDRIDVDDATLVQSQFLEIQVYPHDAMVEIDGEHVEVAANGVASKWVPIGQHSYRVSGRGFRAMPGVADVNDLYKKTVVQVRLQPAVGYLRVEGKREFDGALVYIDNAKIGTLPMDSVLIESGEHIVRISKKMYKPLVQGVFVEDDKLTTMTAELEDNFAVLKIKTVAEAEIWINGEYFGKGEWQGKVESGYKVIEARKKGCKAATKSVELGIGNLPDIDLGSPEPTYGTLSVRSSPKGCKVLVDNELIGSAPLNEVRTLIGEHRITLMKRGYQSVFENIVVDEGRNVSIEKEMTKAYPIAMRCGVDSAVWWVDDDSIASGKRIKVWLGRGRHSVKVTAHGYDDYFALFDVEDESLNYKFEMTKDMPDTIIFVVNGCAFKMVKIDGGCFEMGNDNGNNSEKPVHLATLNSFYISETEVTQKLWVAVTGISLESLRPHSGTNGEAMNVGKGSEMPMYFVNWDDCANLLDLLSQTLGQKFQLPTEAQWEYAVQCCDSNADNYGIWSVEISNGGVHRVAHPRQKDVKLYDMQGNVREWCRDYAGDYRKGMQINPTGPKKGFSHVLRGGSWADYKMACRKTCRMTADPKTRSNKIGFRIVLEIKTEKK